MCVVLLKTIVWFCFLTEMRKTSCIFIRQWFALPVTDLALNSYFRITNDKQEPLHTRFYFSIQGAV